MVTKANAGNYVIYCSDGPRVTAYDSSLTKTVPTRPSSSPGSRYAGASLSCGATFIGGYNSPQIQYYNSSLSKSSVATSLVTKRREHAIGVISDIAIIAGGDTYPALDPAANVSTVETLNGSLTLGSAPSLSVGRSELTPGVVGRYVLFAGGYNSYVSNTYYATVDAYKTEMPDGMEQYSQIIYVI